MQPRALGQVTGALQHRFHRQFDAHQVQVDALIVELLNSAVEAAIDRISLELHPLSKNAKDMGSAAQFTALSLIALVWAIILLG